MSDELNFRFEIPGVMLGGRVMETYEVSEHQWHVTYMAAGREWTGRGETTVEAYIDLIRQRLEITQ